MTEILIETVVWGPHRKRIHKDDLAAAICARFNGRLKRRTKRGPTVVEVGEDFFISGVLNMPGFKMTRINANRFGLTLAARTYDAYRRKKTPPWFDQYDLWLLSNWRTLHLNNGKKLPGLREWRVPAIEKLAEPKFRSFAPLTAKRIERLGLEPGNDVYYDTKKRQFVFSLAR
jgi:hypothetical protein